MGTPWARLTTQKRPGVIGRPYHSCVVFGAYVNGTEAGAKDAQWRCVMGALCDGLSRSIYGSRLVCLHACAVFR